MERDNNRVLIILGEPDGLEKHLFRDVFLSILHASGLPYETGTCLNIFRELIVSSAGDSGVFDKSSGNRYFLLRNPQFTEISSFLSGTLLATPGALSNDMYFCGHGMHGGHLALFGDLATAARLYGAVEEAYTKLNGFPTITLYLNCCYADEALLSIAARASMVYDDANSIYIFDSACTALCIARDNKQDEESAEVRQRLYDEFEGHIEHEIWELEQEKQQTNFVVDEDDGADDTFNFDYGNGVAKTIEKSAPDVADPVDKPSVAVLDADDKQIINTFERVSLRFPIKCRGTDVFHVVPLGFQTIPPAGSLIYVKTKGVKDENAGDNLRDFLVESVDPLLADGSVNYSDALFGLSRAASPGAMDKLTTNKQKARARRHVASASGPTVTMFNVGCGDASMFALPMDADAQSFHLIDGGQKGGWRKWYTHGVGGIDELDRIFISHADCDHVGGIWTLARNLKNGTITTPVNEVVVTVPPDILARTASQYKKVRDCVNDMKDLSDIDSNPLAGATIFSENWTIHVLSPNEGLDDKVCKLFKKSRSVATTTMYNQAALCLLVVWRPPGKKDTNNGVKTMLFTSDVPYEHIITALRQYEWTDLDKKAITVEPDVEADSLTFVVDYMDIPHHGSKLDSDDLLFACVRARTYGWSSNGGASFSSTMADGSVVKMIIDAHTTDGLEATILFTFAEWSGEKVLLYEKANTGPIQCKFLTAGKAAWAIALEPGTARHTEK
jgi:hypothetical protein